MLIELSVINILLVLCSILVQLIIQTFINANKKRRESQVIMTNQVGQINDSNKSFLQFLISLLSPVRRLLHRKFALLISLSGDGDGDVEHSLY